MSNRCYMYHLDQPHAQAVKKMFAELPQKKKYYIICQYANGIKFPYPKKLNFEIHGGHAADLPLPLIYDDDGFLENQPKIPFKNKINLKGKTVEKLGLIGKEKAIACEVLISIKKYD